MAGQVKIVKIPVTWVISHNEALLFQMGTKIEQEKMKANMLEERKTEEDEGMKELAETLDDNFVLIASHVLDASANRYIVYTLYRPEPEREVPF